MKKLLLSLAIAIGGFVTLNAQHHGHNHSGITYKSIPDENGVIRCHTMEMDSIRRSQNPKLPTLEQEEEWLQKKIAEHKDKYGDTKGQKLPVLTIPVVIHVIHNGDAVGSGENIADGQAISQITVMNEDFRKMMGTNGHNTNPVGADIEIEFCLAQVDPMGNPTNGIDRVNTGVDSYNSTGAVETMKTTTIWDPTQYMNIWSVRFGGEASELLGYAQFPSTPTGITGVPAGGAANTDGVVSRFEAFGSIQHFPSGTYMAPFNLGRTITHEVGHWLGLRHIWGDGDCTIDDFCGDTPNCSGQFFSSVPSCSAPSQCGNVRMIQNYMDYSDDGCMNIFTEDQKDRIRTVLLNSPRRNTLPTSTVCNLGPVAPTADFIADQTTVLPATTVSFTDMSTGAPTSWAWTISGTGWTYTGGTNATSQNPQVIFNTLGTYTITLLATNAEGSDTEIKSNYITVTDAVGPCVATSTQTCVTGDEFIANVTLNTINNTTSCSNYTDYTSISTTLDRGSNYSVTVTPQRVGSAIGTAWLDDEIAVWIDWNNDGDFLDAGEQVGYVLVETGWSNVFNFTVPMSATLGSVRMRVRISYEPDDGPISPCGTTEWGETEDYTIIIQDGAPVSAPVTNFVANFTTIPQGGTVNFTDLSTNSPNAWTWAISGSGWSYTGGTNATTQNPQVQFNTEGTYTVSLTAANAGGSDLETKTNYITVTSTQSIEKNILDNISIYPNPTNGALFVNLSGLGIQVTQIVLKDVTGRDIAVKILPNGLVEFDLSYQATGVYFITIQTENNTITKKIIRM